MRKKLVLFILFIVLLLTSVNVYAAKGGKYTFEEGNLKVTVPSNYIVFTRDTTSKDTDIKKYGIDLTELKEQFESGNVYADMITDKKSEIIVMIYEDSSSRDIPNLTEYLKKYPDEFDKMNSSDIIKDFKKSGIEISSMTLYKNSSYYYIHFEGYNSIDKNYAEMYITTINGKFVGFSTIPLADTKITSAQKTALKNFVDKNVSFYDVQPLPASAKPSEGFFSGILAKVLAAALLGIIGSIIAFIKRKSDAKYEPKRLEKEMKEQREKKLKIIQDAADNYNTDIEKNKDILTEEEKQNAVITYEKWKTEADANITDEAVAKGYALITYFKQQDNLDYAVKIAEQLMELSKKRAGSWTAVDDALALDINYALSDDEKLKYASGNLEEKYEKWMKTDINKISIKELKQGYFLLKYFKTGSPKIAENIAKKILEIYNLNIFSSKSGQMIIIKNAKSFNVFGQFTFDDNSIQNIKMKNDLFGWEKINDAQVNGDVLKNGFMMLDYYLEHNDLDTAERIAKRLINLCEEVKSLFDKAISLYSFEPIKDKEYRSFTKATDELIKWNAINDEKLSNTDIQNGYLLLYYFQKQGYLSFTKKISQRLIKIMESRSGAAVKENMVADNSFAYDSAAALASEPQTDSEEIIKMTENTDKAEIQGDDMYIFCRKCGCKLPKESAFCKSCGTKI